MENNNEQNMKGAILQICVMLLNAIGTKNCMSAVAHLKKKYSSYTVNYLSMNKTDKVLDMLPTEKEQTNTWLRYLANMIGKVVGVTFYTVSGRGGFNATHATNTSVAILKHFGCLALTAKGDPVFNKSDLDRMLDPNSDFNKSLVQALTAVEVDEEVTEEAWDSDDDDEFSEFEEVAVSDKVVAFDALSAEAKANYPLAGLLLSFFELIKSCGSATGTILNYKHVSNALGKVKSWRPSDSAKEAIANGKPRYVNGKGIEKQIRCVTSYNDDLPFKFSEFGNAMATEIILKCLNFNFNNKKAIFYDMKDTYMGGDMKKAFGFNASAIRLIMNAVNNGAPSSAIGVGFSQYLDAKDIYAIVDAYTTDGDFYDTYSVKGSASRRGEVIIDDSFDDVLA